MLDSPGATIAIEKNTSVTIKMFGLLFVVPAQDATSELKSIKYTKLNGDLLRWMIQKVPISKFWVTWEFISWHQKINLKFIQTLKNKCLHNLKLTAYIKFY